MELKKKFHLIALAYLTLAFSFSGVSRISWMDGIPKKAEAGLFNADLKSFEDVLLLISKNYVYPPDYQKLFTSALSSVGSIIDRRDASVNVNDDGKILILTGNKNFRYRFGPNMEENFQIFKTIFILLAEKSGGFPSKKKLESIGIEGLMNALDPYSQYLDEKSFERSMRDTEGKYGGLGMVISMEDYQLTVVKTMKNSPARYGGILPQDIIINVDGKPIKGMQIDQLANLMRGYPNTKISLTIFRPETGKHHVYTLTRKIILVETVEYRKVGEETGYLKITSFSKQTDEQLKEALKKASEENVRGFILDLRNNPGGLLDQSVKIASHFLQRGNLVVFTKGRKPNDRDEYRALYEDTLKSVPLAILINHQSASASEIVAGALKDSGQALIVGESSYGKGSVQTIFKIGENEGIRLTTSKYYTPSGIDITKQGILPGVQILDDISFESINELMDKKQLRKEKTSIKLKRSTVEKFLKKSGLAVTRNNDPTLLFSHMIVKQSLRTNKKKLAMETARELVVNFRY